MSDNNLPNFLANVSTSNISNINNITNIDCHVKQYNTANTSKGVHCNDNNTSKHNTVSPSQLSATRPRPFSLPTTLTELDISNNILITEINSIFGSDYDYSNSSLTDLYATGNSIINTEMVISTLKLLPKLSTLQLERNPCQKENSFLMYRKRLLDMLPGLEQLDSSSNTIIEVGSSGGGEYGIDVINTDYTVKGILKNKR